MITKKDIRIIDNKMREFAKRSNGIQHEYRFNRTTMIIKATTKNANMIAEMLDFLGDFDWGNVNDYHGAEFYKYDEIWYHSIDDRWAPDADEMKKYEYTPFYEVLLNFKEE